MDKKEFSSSSRFRQSLISFCDRIAAVCHYISAIAIFTMLSLVVIQVVFRYVFNAPIGWTQELSVFSLMLAVMTGMAVATRRPETPETRRQNAHRDGRASPSPSLECDEAQCLQ